MGPKPTAWKYQAINTQYLANLSDACSQYEDVGKVAGPTTDDEVFQEYGIRKSECEIATFLIDPSEVEKINDMIAQFGLEYDKVWAALIASRQKTKDLIDVLNKIKEMRQTQ